MIHIRTDAHELNSLREFACGIGPALPEGDKWVHAQEYGLHGMVDCPDCLPRREPVGWPASSMDGNAANRHNSPERWANWVAFCDACGHP